MRTVTRSLPSSAGCKDQGASEFINKPFWTPNGEIPLPSSVRLVPGCASNRKGLGTLSRALDSSTVHGEQSIESSSQARQCNRARDGGTSATIDSNAQSDPWLAHVERSRVAFQPVSAFGARTVPSRQIAILLFHREGPHQPSLMVVAERGAMVVHAVAREEGTVLTERRLEGDQIGSRTVRQQLQVGCVTRVGSNLE